MLRPLLIVLALGAPPAAAADPYVWIYQPATRESGPRLAHGLPDSDDVDLMLWCDAGRGRVTVSIVSGADARPPVEFASGPVRAKLPARVVPNELTEGVDLVTVVPAASPLMARFAATGQFAYRFAGVPWVPTASGRREAAAFLTACRER